MHPANKWFIAAGLFLGATIAAAQVQQFPIGVGQSANGGGGGSSTTPGGTNGQIQYNNSNAFGGFTMSQDCTITTGGVITCTKTNNVALGSFATGTNAANLTGTVACAQMPALTGAVTTSAGSCATSGGLQTKMISLTRDISATSGSVAYTGCGFQPTALNIIGKTTSADTNPMWGFSDSTKAGNSLATYDLTGNTTGNANPFIGFSGTTGADFQTGAISSYDADGFTINWTKTGASASVSYTFTVRCQK
jgi:hypothetical protein